MQKTISLWEKTKRIVAHAFNLQTRAEIREYYERKEQEELQAQLRLEHHQHVRSLLVEYADHIEQYQQEKESRRISAEKEILRQEMIKLYKDNRKLQDEAYYRNSHVEEDIDTTQE